MALKDTKSAYTAARTLVATRTAARQALVSQLETATTALVNAEKALISASAAFLVDAEGEADKGK